MKQFSYNIVSKRIPVVHLTDKNHVNKINDHTINQSDKQTRVIDTDCMSCEFVSDGSTVIKLSELVKKLREHKEIKLYPLSLSINNNVTEHYAANQGEGFSAVTIHVDVQSSSESMTPTKIVCKSMYGLTSYEFQSKLTTLDTFSYVLIQLYPIRNNRNCIEILTDNFSEYDIKEGGYYALIPKTEYGVVTKLTMFGKSKGTEYMIYELESSTLQQNQKITVLNYLK